MASLKFFSSANSFRNEWKLHVQLTSLAIDKYCSESSYWKFHVMFGWVRSTLTVYAVLRLLLRNWKEFSEKDLIVKNVLRDSCRARASSELINKQPRKNIFFIYLTCNELFKKLRQTGNEAVKIPNLYFIDRRSIPIKSRW